MRIKITSENTYQSLDTSPNINGIYALEDDTEGTGKQNRFFHKLVTLYFNSGCFSDDVGNVDELKQSIKKRLGIGFVQYYYDTSKDIPEWKRGTTEDARFNRELFASWRDYTKHERKETINNLIHEMLQADVSSKEFDEMIKESASIFL